MNDIKILDRYEAPKVPLNKVPHHRTTLESMGNPFSDKKSIAIMQQRYISAGVSLKDVEINVVHTTYPKKLPLI